MLRRWLFRWRLRRERRWRDFLASLQPPTASQPQPEHQPDVLAAALSGAANLVTAFTGAEIERLKATEQDRQREFEARQKAREEAREARRKALADRGRDSRGRVLPRANAAATCRVCSGDYPYTPADVDRHYAEGHQPVPPTQ